MTFLNIPKILNTTANCVYTVIPGNSVPSMLLGATGAWVVGMDPRLGCLQGGFSSLGYSWVIKPITKYVEANSGEKEDQINLNTRRLLGTLGSLFEMFGPVLLTMYIGPKVIDTVTPYLPQSVNKLVSTKPTKEYTIFRGMLANIAPVILQYAIEKLREEEKVVKTKEKKS